MPVLAFAGVSFPSLNASTSFRLEPCRVPTRCVQPPLKSRPPSAIVIGAGVAGLTAASTLAAAGLPVTLLEASDAVGGRVRTDVVDGYRLDRGFQVFLEGYPACCEALDYAALDLRRFLPGATIRHAAAFHTISDPFRAPLLALSGVLAPVGTLLDKLRVARLRFDILNIPLRHILQATPDPTATALAYLQRAGFTPRFISAFFAPFYQGIFLAPLAEQSRAMFQFVFRMLAVAPASLPALGMGAVPEQMRAALPAHVCVHLRTRVDRLQGRCVHVDGGDVHEGSVVVVATEGPAAARLLGGEVYTSASRGSVTLYFKSDAPSPLARPILVLDGEGDGGGPVNNMCVPTSVAEEYAPEGKTLISATIVGDEMGRADADVERDVRAQMADWFGDSEVAGWELLRIYRIPHSQPAQTPDFVFDRGTVVGGGVFVCGDHRNSPTLNGAIVSGRTAADEALKFLGKASTQKQQ